MYTAAAVPGTWYLRYIKNKKLAGRQIKRE